MGSSVWAAVEAARHATVMVHGEIDLSNVAFLERRLVRCLARGATHVTVDMTDLDFIDCAGMSTILAAAQRLGAGRVVVRNPPPSARTILRLTGLEATVAIEHPDADCPGESR
jgi:anti-sigma B factor antagonist